jgi:dCTP deaminase
MVLSCHALRVIRPVEPFVERTVLNGMTYGLSTAGYDIRIKDSVHVEPGHYVLGVSYEKFNTPCDVIGIVHDKSTWARRGLAIQNTVIEAGWIGYLTLEISNHSRDAIFIGAGSPIAQVVYHKLDQAVRGYNGKYQDQPAQPVEAIYE